MLLRASGENAGDSIELDAVIRGGTPGAGIRGGEELLAFTDAAMGVGEADLHQARERLREVLGDAASVDAAGVIGNFERMVRIADGTGIPLDKPVAMVSARVREEIGIDEFATSVNTPKLNAVQRLIGRGMERMMPVVLRIVGRGTRAPE